MTGVRTVTLTEFLLARIGEDEAVAREIARGPRRSGKTTARRRLADCMGKQQIVALHDADADGRFCLSCGDGDYYGVGYPCPTVRALALPYADHPDYRDEWKP